MISQQQEIVRTSPPPVDDTRATGSYGALLKRKADLEAQIEDYSSKFTEKYPKLVQAREQLAEVKQRIAGASATGEQARASATRPRRWNFETCNVSCRVWKRISRSSGARSIESNKPPHGFPPAALPLLTHPPRFHLQLMRERPASLPTMALKVCANGTPR